MTKEIGYWTAWDKVTKRWRWARGCTAVPPCCYCRRSATELQVRFWNIRRGTPIRHIPYMTPPPEIRCAPDKGCNRAPWSRAGAHLREMMIDGFAPFIRRRDGKRMMPVLWE